MITWLIKQLSHPIRISKQTSQSVKTLATLLIQKWDSFLTSETWIWAILREYWFRNLKNFQCCGDCKEMIYAESTCRNTLLVSCRAGFVLTQPANFKYYNPHKFAHRPMYKNRKTRSLHCAMATPCNDSMKLRIQTMSVSKFPFHEENMNAELRI